jgi:hypothetical protein
MAIKVTGTNPTAVTVASPTYTKNTTYNGSQVDDRNYVIADAIAGTVNAGVMVHGYGLRLQTTEALGGIAMVNNGSVISEEENALHAATAAR